MLKNDSHGSAVCCDMLCLYPAYEQWSDPGWATRQVQLLRAQSFSSHHFIFSLSLILLSLSPLPLSLSCLLLPPTSPPSPPLFPSVIICKRTTPSSSASSVKGGLAGAQSEHFKTSCQKACSSFSFLELWTTTVRSFGSGFWKKKLWSYAFVCDVSGVHGGKLQQGGCCSQAWTWVRPDLTWTVALRLLSEEAHANRVFM